MQRSVHPWGSHHAYDHEVKYPNQGHASARRAPCICPRCRMPNSATSITPQSLWHRLWTTVNHEHQSIRPALQYEPSSNSCAGNNLLQTAVNTWTVQWSAHLHPSQLISQLYIYMGRRRLREELSVTHSVSQSPSHMYATYATHRA